MILTAEGLSFKYPSRHVLTDICFSVEKGECLAIMGTNGAGKSTLLKCINRILKPQLGVIYIGDNASSDLKNNELARLVGYVSQQQERNRSTVFDSVLLGRRPHIKWNASERDYLLVGDILELLGLSDYSMRYIDELSGGELQKVAIARALAQEPDLLLLDEPTSSLDLKNQLEVMQMIKGIVKKQKIAAAVTMHDLNMALRFADKFLMLRSGSIFAAGGLEIITPENIQSVYSVPVAIQHYRDIPTVIPL